MDMNLMLIIVQENDAESLASAFKRSQIQATRIDANPIGNPVNILPINPC